MYITVGIDQMFRTKTCLEPEIKLLRKLVQCLQLFQAKTLVIASGSSAVVKSCPKKAGVHYFPRSL